MSSFLDEYTSLVVYALIYIVLFWNRISCIFAKGLTLTRRSHHYVTRKILSTFSKTYKMQSKVLINFSLFTELYDPLSTIIAGLTKLVLFPWIDYDYLGIYRGNDFLRPLVILQKSKIEGAEYAQKILKTLERGENVIILSNHQTEADPQVLSILLESVGLAQLAEQIIFIAGHKVTNDPVAIPFSMVLCQFGCLS